MIAWVQKGLAISLGIGLCLMEGTSWFLPTLTARKDMQTESTASVAIVLYLHCLPYVFLTWKKKAFSEGRLICSGKLVNSKGLKGCWWWRGGFGIAHTSVLPDCPYLCPGHVRVIIAAWRRWLCPEWLRVSELLPSGGLDLWLWNPWNSGDLLGALTEASVQWPGGDPWSIISLKILFMWALGSHLLAAPGLRGPVGGRQRGSPGCAVIAVPMTHVFYFFMFSPENAILVFPPVLCWGRSLDEEEVTQAGRFKGGARCLRNLAKKHMRLTSVLLTIVCSLWKKNSENSEFSALSQNCKVACHQRGLHRDFI